ncbi:MAG: PrsW family glutamic-type intramembrane protease [Bacteroidota bacterium]
MTFELLAQVAVSCAPVLVFLTGLMLLDSYKLVPVQSVLVTVLLGCVAAGASVVVNMAFLAQEGIELTMYARYGAPEVEELCKAIWPFLLIRSRKVGFMVDAGVHGFAIGAGFAIVENVYYLQSLEHASLFTWIVRGFGTAVMHGGTTAVFAIVAKNLTDIAGSESWYRFLPALGLAAVIHSAYNHFFLPPILNTVLILASLPPLMLVIFQASERATRQWLGVGFDTDADMLNLITSGNVSETPLGKYLHTLSTRFRPEVVVDLLCYLRIYLELAVQAKGILMMREAGFDVPPAPDVEAKFTELSYLEKSIGRTGHLALLPFLRTSSRDLWQLHMLRSTGTA